MPRRRCPWSGDDQLMIRYHDLEWGRPVRRDRKMFEFLVLESAQAGLSWRTILHRRAGYRRAFANFDPTKVARFTGRDVQRLVRDRGIIRNRLKIKATINNARRFLEVQQEYGTFCRYLWGFVQDQPIVRRRRHHRHLPAITPLAIRVATDLKSRGFQFLGPTVVYAHLQATGLVNDHLLGCFCHPQHR
jgi:DNA-3-methyladenine glycosylase I